MNRDDIYIIVPAFNEASVIRENVKPLTELYHVVVVDDASTDDTFQRLWQLNINYLRHPVNLGQGAAIQTGVQYALSKGARVLATFDADGQHDPADLAGMVEMLEANKLDMIFGSRFLRGSKANLPAGRKFTLKLARWINYFFTGILLSDAHNGLRVFSRKFASTMDLRENRMAHATEMLMRVAENSSPYGEYPVNIRYTRYSRNKGQSVFNSLRIFFEIVLNKIFD